MQNIDKLKEYITYRNMAFESKYFEDIKNPLPYQHFCNNQKYLDAFSQDIIHGNLQLDKENAGVQEMLYNTLVHRVLLNKEFCKDNSDEHGIFRINDHNKLVDKVDKFDKSFSGRYRNMMQNRYLAKISAGDFFDKIVSTILPQLEKFNKCSQTEIWKDDDLSRHGYQCGPFTKYQLSSDLLYIPKLEITPDYVDYCNLGTAILEINKEYDHKTEATEIMIPSDANNVLCEFYKYTVSKKTRYRKPEVITHPSMSIEIPENLRRFKNV